jgi:hypothetical protein
MKNTNDPPDDENHLATPIWDYRTLLQSTRRLVIKKQITLPPSLLIHRDQPISLETGDCHEESVLKTGEIVFPDLSGQSVTSDPGLSAMTALLKTGSNLRIRIYIGMS